MTTTQEQGDANYEHVKAVLTQNSEALVNFAAENLCALGALSEWSLDDNFAVSEGLVRLAAAFGLPNAGDQSADELEFYGKAAYALGYPSEWEEEHPHDYGDYSDVN